MIPDNYATFSENEGVLPTGFPADVATDDNEYWMEKDGPIEILPYHCI